MKTTNPLPSSPRKSSRAELGLILLSALVLGSAAGCSERSSDQAAAGAKAAGDEVASAVEAAGETAGELMEGAVETAGKAMDAAVDAAETALARTWPEGTVLIGEPIQAGEPVKLAAVQADPTAYFEKTILVEATAAAICQARGCWMTITDGEGEPIWVRWSSGCGGKYAFPKDAAGRRMIVQGSFYEKEIDAAAAEHLAAENETIDKDAIVGKTFEMNATGCVVLPAEAKDA